MIEFATIKVHYGYCPKCAEPVKLRRMHTVKKEDHYWKIIGHFGCSMDGKPGEPKEGAKEALFKKHCLVNEKAELKRRRGKTGKPRGKILPYEEGYQPDLFRTPVVP